MNFFDNDSVRKFLPIGQILLLIIIVILNLLLIINRKENKVVNPDRNVALVSKEEVKEEKCIKEEDKIIRVDVKGAVKKEGVYLLKEKIEVSL